MSKANFAGNISLTWILLAAACAPTQQSGGKSSQPSPPSPTGDSEQNVASAPMQVTGSFLVDCANVGESGYGCVAQDPTSHKKVAVDQMNVTVVYTDKSQTTPTTTAAPAASPWSVFFTVPSAMIHKIGTLQVATKIGGLQQPIQTIDATALAINPITAQDLAATANVMFITSVAYQPGADDFVGFDAMNATCKSLGAASKLIPDAGKLKWMPMLSIFATKPSDTLPDIVQYIGPISGPVVNTAGRVVVADGAQFWGPHAAAVITDENGGYVGGDALVWTGSDATGLHITNSTCQNWGALNPPGASDSGAVGVAGSLTDWLKTANDTPCLSLQHVYCFGQR